MPTTAALQRLWPPAELGPHLQVPATFLSTS